MCDYSLHHVGSRPAKVNDKLVVTELARSSTRGFAAVGEHGVKLVIDDAPPKVAVCLLPGTELAFEDYIQYDRGFSLFGKARMNHKLARFRQIDMDDPHVQYDALEFPDGQVLKAARLVAGQTARVLQLPVATAHPEHHSEPVQIGRPADSRLALDRAPVGHGIASVLIPSQGTVMLWQTCRSAAVRLSIAFGQSFRRLKAHKRHTILRAALHAGVDTMRIRSSFENGVVAVSPPKAPAAQKRQGKIEVRAGTLPAALPLSPNIRPLEVETGQAAEGLEGGVPSVMHAVFDPSLDRMILAEVARGDFQALRAAEPESNAFVESNRAIPYK